MTLRPLSMTPTLAPSLPNNSNSSAGPEPEARQAQEAAKDENLIFTYIQTNLALSISK